VHGAPNSEGANDIKTQIVLPDSTLATLGLELTTLISPGHAQEPVCPPAAVASSQRPRQGIGLSLSGGAYRAALFHMGALRRLNELGLLHRVDEISSVSGGRIASAHLATYLSKSGRKKLAGPIAADTWEAEVAGPFRVLAQRDFRTAPLLKRLLPWNWFRASVEVDTMAEGFRHYLP
jgi:NTE family protein